MISFESFHIEEGIPIYLQILRHIQRGAVAGTIHDGDELPSRRVLSALLGVNPNTIQKAYRMLEEDGLIQSHSGAKSYMVLDEAAVQRLRGELVETDAKTIIRALQQMGISKAEALELIETYWE